LRLAGRGADAEGKQALTMLTAVLGGITALFILQIVGVPMKGVTTLLAKHGNKIFGLLVVAALVLVGMSAIQGFDGGSMGAIIACGGILFLGVGVLIFKKYGASAGWFVAEGEQKESTDSDEEAQSPKSGKQWAKQTDAAKNVKGANKYAVST